MKQVKTSGRNKKLKNKIENFAGKSQEQDLSQVQIEYFFLGC